MSEPDDNIDEMYEEVKALFRRLIAEANHILKAGTPANKISLMRSVIPVLMREMQAREKMSGEEEVKAQLSDLFASARADLDASKAPALNDIDDLPADHPAQLGTPE